MWLYKIQIHVIDFSKPLCVIFLQAYACVRVCIPLYACMRVLPSVSLLTVVSGEQCGLYGARATAPGGRTRGQLCDKHTRCGRLYLSLRGEGTHKCDVVLSHVLCCLVSGTHILTSELIPVLEKSKSPRVVRVRHGYERRGREGERREGGGKGEWRGGKKRRGRRRGEREEDGWEQCSTSFTVSTFSNCPNCDTHCIACHIVCDMACHMPIICSAFVQVTRLSHVRHMLSHA